MEEVRGLSFSVVSVLVLLLALTTGVHCQPCQLPEDLRGRNMTSNAVGVVTTTDTTIVFQEGLRDCSAVLCQNYSTLTFECQENQGDVYFFKSEAIEDGSLRLHVYFCWYISQEISTNKWVYYQAPNAKHGFYQSYVFSRLDTFTVSFSDVCDLRTPLTVSKYSLLLDSGSMASQSSSCPDDLLATFNTSQASPSCLTDFDVCSTSTRQTVIVSNPSCRADDFFTGSGKMDCLHSLSQNGVTYVTMFTPENDTVIFSCMAFIKQGDTVYANFQGSNCEGLASPSTSAHEVSMEPTVLCPYPCTFPAGLLGQWSDSRTGLEVNVSATELSNFFSCANPPCDGPVNTLQCYRTESNRYLIRTPVTTVDSQSVRVYICLQLTQLTSTKYLYYRSHRNTHGTLNDYVVTFNSGQSVSLAQACEDISASPYPATRHHLLVSSGSEASSFISCPSGLQGMYNNTNNSCASTYDTCDGDTQLKLTGTDCTPKPFYSEGGTVGCLYSVAASGLTYVTLYNTDPSPDGTNTFAFTCVALQQSGSTLKLSQNPLHCVDSQTATSITTSNGALFEYEETGEECNPTSETDYTLIIIIVVVILLLIIIIIIIICCCLKCRKRRAKKRQKDDADAILTKEDLEDDERGSNLSLDSGYPRSSTRTESTPGRGGMGSLGFGTPGSHFAEVYEVAEEQDPKEVNVVSHRRRRRTVEPTAKDEDPPQTEENQEANYSDASWEEYVDEDGNQKVRPKEGGHRRRRKKKKTKHAVVRTHVLADGTTVVEEVESEYSVTGSSEEGSSDEDRERMSDQIRAQKEIRRTRLQRIMEEGPVSTAVITTREMDEKARQPEKKKRSVFDKVRRGARNRRRKSKVHNQGMFPNDAGKDKVPGVEREIPFLLQYQAKKDIEKTLNDEGFFDDPDDKNMAETVFGFEKTDRELSPKPSDYGTMDETTEKEGLVTATDSSQLEVDKTRSRDISDAANQDLEEGREEAELGTTADKNIHGMAGGTISNSPSEDDMKGTTEDRNKHGTADGTTSPSPSDDEMKETTEDRSKDGMAGGTTSPSPADEDVKGTTEDRNKHGTAGGTTSPSPSHEDMKGTAEDRSKDGMAGGTTSEDETKGTTDDRSKHGTAGGTTSPSPSDEDMKGTTNDRSTHGLPGIAILPLPVGGERKGTTQDQNRIGDPEHASSPVPSSDDELKGTKEKNKHVTIGRASTSSTFDSDAKGSGKDGSRKRVTIRRGSVSPAYSLESDLQDDSSGRKSSDTSSGVADLGGDGHKDSRRHDGGGGGRERGHGLFGRHSMGHHGFGPGGKEKEGSEGRGTASKIGHSRSKQKEDKRVKTALRRLLNDRLFGSSDKKKSRRDDDAITDNWTNADSVANNVSETSSLAGTRGGTRQTLRPVTVRNEQGKVAFAEVDPCTGNPRSSSYVPPKQSELGPAQRFKQHGLHGTNEDNAKNSRERLSTRGGSNLPALKTPTMSLDRAFTPAHFPKWGLCVTASQRSMLVEGLHRDRTFLSRRQARTAWSTKTDDSMILPPHSARDKGDDMADDESYLDPHRPDSEEQGKENEEGQSWAHRRNPQSTGHAANGGPVAYTKASGKSPMDIDDRRLRKLLEELYKEKKFMDNLISKIDEDHLEFPDHMAADDVKFLSEFGRGYLLERAQYWELHGPLGPPRAPPTALGLRLSRNQTSVTSTGGRKPSDERSSSPRPKTVR